MLRLAQRMSRIDSSGIRKVFDLARSLKDPINLSIGQPDFDVPTPVKASALAAIQAGRNRYTPTQGIAELRDLIIAEELKATGRRWAPDEVLITSGVSGGIFLALLALVEEGAEVVMADPCFVMYRHLVNLLGGTCVGIDTYDTGFRLDPHRLAAALTDRTRLVLLNSPANPTGTVLSESEMRAIAEVCTAHGIPLLSDEIYRDFAYVPAPSPAAHHAHTLVLGGFSKNLAMTGWRLGYACGPRPLIQAMTMAQQYTFVCAPSFAQYAALAWPEVDFTPYLATYRAKRDLMVGLLRQSFQLASPDGAFYLWVQAPSGWDGDSFARRCLDHQVLVIPGSVFSQRNSHFRICYTVDDDRLRRGAEILCRVADERPGA